MTNLSQSIVTSPYVWFQKWSLQPIFQLTVQDRKACLKTGGGALGPKASPFFV